MTLPHPAPTPRLRIAWFGHDWGIACAQEAVARGHTIARLFTDDLQGGRRTAQTRAFAKALGLPVHRGRPTPEDLAGVEGADVIVCAGYPWRIPVAPGRGPRGLNIHPSLLPEGRGPQPFSHVILQGLARSGVTIHELAERMDRGPIVHQESFAVLARETHDTLSARSQLLAQRLLVEVLDDLDGFWARQRPQGEGSWWPVPTDDQRALPLAGRVEDIDRVARAFAPGAATAGLGGRPRGVASAVVWNDAHGLTPGTLVRATGRDALVAASDGYALLRLAPWRPPGRALVGRIHRRTRRVVGAIR